jgi:hypothetical protein
MRGRGFWLAAATMATAVGLATPSCTTFDGISASRPDAAAVDASGDAGVAGDAGVGSGLDAALDAGPPHYLSLDEAARVCSLIAVCPHLAYQVLILLAIDAPADNYSLCMEWLAGPLPPSHIGIDAQRSVLSCLAQASRCEETYRCEWYYAPQPGSPLWTDAGTRCEGEALFDYSDPAQLWVTNCASAFYADAGTCLSTEDGGLTCALPGCAPDVTADGVCRHNVQYKCESGVTNIVNCEISGANCVGGGCMYTSCDVEGSSCSSNDVIACDGTLGATFNCDDLGATCDEIGGHARCSLPREQCSSFDLNANTCSQNTLSICVGGKSIAYDCTRVGAGCADGMCQPPTADAGVAPDAGSGADH